MQKRKAESGGLQRSIRRKMDLFLPQTVDPVVVGDGDADQGDDVVLDLRADADPQGRDAGNANPADDGAAGGGVENLFPHECHTKSDGRCAGCVRSLPTDGYKAARNKLNKVYTKCSRCMSATCKKHYVLVCTSCTNDLQLKENYVDGQD